MKNKRKAFTLIELLVVIVIIGILATVSTATFKNSIDKGRQGNSFALQAQIDTLIQADCLVQGYSCGKNIVPNWAFSDGNTGDWILTTRYEISQYKLRHEIQTPGSGAVDYIYVPTDGSMVDGDVYRVDVVARDIVGAGAGGDGVGFSALGTGIGLHARISTNGSGHLCDVFQYDEAAFSPPNTASIRLFFRRGTGGVLDEVSIRKVEGAGSVTANDDCTLEGIAF